ncbi:hypothetical protein P153DRAFT_294727 [Dothidotthia symphoricarpi CBS 119687]|uniref:Uncharacterized protein n=1 Tax=Dothidotthia symphoricarpi CBS 119687 TaxID=1392245 RepID=A0A6A6AAE1_9PLEO|nr:uncharacterized protein P153DRAFT_294727 [Dothidotthia symphoricarpi CBS 119687]KAF2127651.1 hypothetical protein P153DRAFT_294727 [Dothidotthia symphoricarpi CBS 119687]
MSAQQSSQAFRFMDLPGEIRNNVYDLLLCSWDEDLEQDQNSNGTFSRRFLKYPATALLRTSKQVHSEASDYMAKRNQFVHITCRGMDIRRLFLHEVPVVTSDERKTSQFMEYAMHLTLTKPMLSSTTFDPSEYKLMVLCSDLPFLCEKLDIESAMMDVNVTADEHRSIRAEIGFNHTYAPLSIAKFQERLLRPIATLVRGIPNLSIRGPVDSILARAVIEETAKPRWTDPDAILGEIRTGVDVGKRQWQQNNYYMASESWNYSMRTLERMRHSSSWVKLRETGGEDFVNSTADLYFTLNLLSAQFIQVDMENESDQTFIKSSGNIAIQHLQKCRMTSARFALHAAATWTPNNMQQAKMMYRHAKCLRLMKDSANGAKALRLIQAAVALSPLGDRVLEKEEKDILEWNVDIRAETVMAGMIEDARQDTHAQSQSILGSLWSYVWSGISELAS